MHIALCPLNHVMATRVMFVGTGSDVGKSVLTAGFCRILSNRGISVAPVQVPEHGPQLLCHPRRGRNRPGPGGAGPGLRHPAPHRHEPGAAQAQFRYRQPGDRPGDRWSATWRCRSTTPISPQAFLKGGRELPTAVSGLRLHRHRRGRQHRRDQPEGPRHRQPADRGDGRLSRASWWPTSTGAGSSPRSSAHFELLEPTETERASRGSSSTSSAATRRCSRRESSSWKRGPASRSWGSCRISRHFRIPGRRQRGVGKTGKRAKGIAAKGKRISIGVIRFPRISNYTDFDALEAEPDVELRYIEESGELGGSGRADSSREQVHHRRPAVSRETGTVPANTRICRTDHRHLRRLPDARQQVVDPDGVESSVEEAEGLGLLDVETVLLREKETHQAEARLLPAALLIAPNAGDTVSGYEIHMGKTTLGPTAKPFSQLLCRSGCEVAVLDGAVSADGRVFGTYLHGIFDNHELPRGLSQPDPHGKRAGRSPRSRTHALTIPSTCWPNIWSNTSTLAAAATICGIGMSGIDPVILLYSPSPLDLFLGDPRWLPHPVVGIGRLISALEMRPASSDPKRADRWCSAAVLSVVGTTALLACLLLKAGLCHTPLPGRLRWPHVLSYTCLAARSLHRESSLVADRLVAGDLDGARRIICPASSDGTRTDLDEPEIWRALVETVAENTSDGVIAPLFYLMLGGPVLGLAYKAVNTLDSMVGYKNERYLRFGWASARFDDLANWLPARLTGLLMVVAAPLDGPVAAEAFRSCSGTEATIPPPTAAFRRRPRPARSGCSSAGRTAISASRWKNRPSAIRCGSCPWNPTGE